MKKFVRTAEIMLAVVLGCAYIIMLAVPTLAVSLAGVILRGAASLVMRIGEMLGEISLMMAFAIQETYKLLKDAKS